MYTKRCPNRDYSIHVLYFLYIFTLNIYTQTRFWDISKRLFLRILVTYDYCCCFRVINISQIVLKKELASGLKPEVNQGLFRLWRTGCCAKVVPKKQGHSDEWWIVLCSFSDCNVWHHIDSHLTSLNQLKHTNMIKNLRFEIDLTTSCQTVLMGTSKYTEICKIGYKICSRFPVACLLFSKIGDHIAMTRGLCIGWNWMVSSEVIYAHFWPTSNTSFDGVHGNKLYYLKTFS